MAFAAGLGVGLTALLLGVVLRVALWAMTVPLQIAAMLVVSFIDAVFGGGAVVEDVPDDVSLPHEIAVQHAMRHHLRVVGGAA